MTTAIKNNERRKKQNNFRIYNENEKIIEIYRENIIDLMAGTRK